MFADSRPPATGPPLATALVAMRTLIAATLLLTGCASSTRALITVPGASVADFDRGPAASYGAEYGPMGNQREAIRQGPQPSGDLVRSAPPQPATPPPPPPDLP